MADKIRVLLVEDNDGDARLIEENLRESGAPGFAVLRAVRLQEAVDKLAAERCDVVLLDLTLPDARGLETLRRVRGRVAAAPIVIMTGLDAEEIGLQAVKEGAQDYLVKGEPASRSLARTIRHAIERQQGQAALRASMEEFRTLAEAMPQIVWITKPDGKNVFLNQHWMEYTGLKLEESLGDGWSRPLHPQDRERAENAWRKSTSEGSLYSVECRLRRFDGSYRWWLVRAVPYADAAGNVVKWYGTCTDINDLKLAEQTIVLTDKALVESEGNYRHLFDAIADPIFIIDPGTLRVSNANRAALELYGYVREEIVGSDFTLLSQEPDNTARSLETAGSDGLHFVPQRQHRRKNGDVFWVEIHYSSFTSNDQKMVIAVVRDISRRVEADARLKNAEAQLRQSQKMEAIGRLAGGVAHDFNNLLTAISGYSDFLLESLAPDDARREDVVSIKQAGTRAAALTRQLLAFSRQQALQIEILDCSVVVTQLLKILERVVGEDVKINTALAPDTGCIKADAGQIDQILMNLVVNSRDAMPRGGRITIETANVDLDAEYVQMHLEAKPGPYVMFAVTDTGTGMDDNAKEHLFEPFFTTKEQGKGTGLGLATVYGIVQQSGGRIYVYSELGQGTTIKVYFPRVVRVAEAAKPKPAAANALSGSETILLVEDDAMVRAFIHRLLLQHGYDLLLAPAPAEALELCEKTKAPIHLILSDVIMPQMRGPEMVKLIAQAHPESKVIFMSGYSDVTAAHPRGVDVEAHFLQKPLSLEMLLRKVREVLDGSR